MLVFLIRKWCVSPSFILGSIISGGFFFRTQPEAVTGKLVLSQALSTRLAQLALVWVCPELHLTYIHATPFHPPFPINLTCKIDTTS